MPRRLLCPLAVFVCCKCLTVTKRRSAGFKKIAISYVMIILIILRTPSILLGHIAIKKQVEI